MADLIVTALDPERVRANLARVRERIAAAARTAGRRPGEVEVVAAVKYVPAEDLAALAQAGIELVGENRAQALLAKQQAHPGRFAWDFIGRLQSRKVRLLVGRVRLLHTVCSDSALAALARHADPSTEVLVEVNVSGEPGKAGLAPGDLDAFLERCPVRVGGLMTMPPATGRAEDSRRWFAALRELAERHGLSRLSMGTSQDYPVAVEEGATIVRLGEALYR